MSNENEDAILYDDVDQNVDDPPEDQPFNDTYVDALEGDAGNEVKVICLHS